MEKKPVNKIPQMPIFMCMGCSIGMAIGAAMDNIGIGMCVGVALGVCVGSILDQMNRNQDSGSEEKEDL